MTAVGAGRQNIMASGAVVLKLPSMKKEQKRFALVHKDQKAIKLEFYLGACDEKKTSETWEPGPDFAVKVDQKSNTMEFKRKKDGQVCVLTCFKAPCTKDPAAVLKQFVAAVEYLGDVDKNAKLKALDTSVNSDHPTLQEQGGKAAGGGGGAAASPSSKGGGGGGGSGGGEEIKPGLFEIWNDVPEGRTLSFNNTTSDTLFKIGIEFKNVEGQLKLHTGCKKLPDGKQELEINPGEKKEFARGKWNGQKKGIRTGAPDKAWLAAQAKQLAAEVEADIKSLKELLKKEGLKKVSAEAIADVCVKKQRQFIDLTFPPTKESLFRDWETGMVEVPWKRPCQYLKDEYPALFVGKIEPEDIDQGSLGDCYLLSALACLSEFEPLVQSIFDEGQDYDLGIYRATLCKNGWWHTITMDSYFPFARGGPTFAKNREELNELWVSLLEKAYAKLHGSYASIRAGSGGMALADLTGCPYELFDESRMKPDLFKELEENDANDYIQMLGTPGKDTSDYAGGAKTSDAADLSKKYESVGLACGHAYSLITVKEYKGNQLCMIRNPWGNDKEWNGDWSDKSKKWTPDIKKAVGWYDGNDGTFWMCWKDVCQWFTSASVCYVNGAWDQLRAAACYDGGVSDLILKVTCKKDSDAWVGIHQKDNRGIKKGTDAVKYLPVQLNILVEDSGKLKSEHSPAFKPSRDQNTTFKFKKGSTYYIMAQSSDDKANRAFAYSMHVAVPQFAEIEFLTPKKGQRYNPPTKMDPAEYEATEAVYQVKGIFSTNGSAVERQGAKVDFSKATRVLTARELEVRKVPNSKKTGCAAMASFPLEVTAICGKGLPVMDDNGASDPYLELKLRGLDEEGNVTSSHIKPQTQVTPAIDATLNPKWGTKHPFSCSGDDALHVICYDRDTKGKDYMGEFFIKLGELDLQPGGTPVKKTYKLTGEIELGPNQTGPTKGEIEIALAIPKA